MVLGSQSAKSGTAMISATLPPAHLVAALGVSRTTQDSARIGGALAGAGFVARNPAARIVLLLVDRTVNLV